MNRRNFTLSLLAATAPMAITRTAVAQTAPGAIPAMEYFALASKGSTFQLTTAQDGYTKSPDPAIHRFTRAEVNEQVTLSAKLNRVAGTEPASVPGSVIGAAVAAPFAIAGTALSAAGSLLGVPLTTDNQKAATIARLAAMPAGPAYDFEFVNAQIIGHNEAYGIHGSYAQSGDDPALRNVARGALPLIRLHLAQLSRMQRMMQGQA